MLAVVVLIIAAVVVFRVFTGRKRSATSSDLEVNGSPLKGSEQKQWEEDEHLTHSSEETQREAAEVCRRQN